MKIQDKIFDWCIRTVGEAVARDFKIRAIRVLEEAIELAQAECVDKATVHAWVDHVYSRPVGEVHQEGAGVAVCLAAWGSAHGVDIDTLAEEELNRVDTPAMIEKIREKQKEKNAVGVS